MNPNLFTSRIYGYNTNSVSYQKQMKEDDMQNVVDKVLYEMNTQPHRENSYYTTPNQDLYSIPKKPEYIKSNYNKNSMLAKSPINNSIHHPQEEIKNSQPSIQFTPEFYNVLKDMISKEFDRREKNRDKNSYKQILKKLQYYEKKINLLENEIVILKKF